MKIRAWCLSHKGLVRDGNEDAALVNDVIVRDDGLIQEFEWKGQLLPFVVADGMGGHAHGEVASRYALETFREMLKKLNERNGEIRDQLEKNLRSIHSSLLEMMADFGDLGTTLCGILFTQSGKVMLVNVGDSRLYRLRGRFLRQLSQDHSLRAETGNPNIPGNWLTSVLGGGSRNLKVSIKDITRMVRAGDTILVCSDGLSEYVAQDEILAALRPAIEDPSEELVSAACAYGGFDNITVIVLKLSE